MPRTEDPGENTHHVATKETLKETVDLPSLIKQGGPIECDGVDKLGLPIFVKSAPVKSMDDDTTKMESQEIAKADVIAPEISEKLVVKDTMQEKDDRGINGADAPISNVVVTSANSTKRTLQGGTVQKMPESITITKEHGKDPSQKPLNDESTPNLEPTQDAPIDLQEVIKHQENAAAAAATTRTSTNTDRPVNAISEFSHQHIAPKEPEKEEDSEGEWQTMPAFAAYDMYDDDNRLVARERLEIEDDAEDQGLGGAGKGYTRVQLDEDAQSATSLDEHTQYLFKGANGETGAGFDDDDQRDAVSQMQATKDLLTEGQRIAYVGMTRLALANMCSAMQKSENLSRNSKKETALASEAMKMWSQKMMVRLYAHMDISAQEQVMIEQLADHGVLPGDMTPTLMQNSTVKNPMADKSESPSSRPGSSSTSGMFSPRESMSSSGYLEEEAAKPPPAYKEHEGDDLPEVRTPSQLPTTKNIDIDLRWTVLCDLFLTLIADSIYDARSRVLLEEVGKHMEISTLEICRFEKRVTDALEMQQAAEKENWNEDEHKEDRRKAALKKRYLMMGLATVGGSLVIGLSAGLLAPVIGAGLAAGFTTIGVAGTGGFLAGAGGAAIITAGAATSGGIIAVRAADRRTGAVKTFEYRPLHNNKRVNLIVTVSGWMTGKVDDVRLPYSTIDPIMGDIYSVLWEPEMLTSMGQTINILATEVSSISGHVQ